MAPVDISIKQNLHTCKNPKIAPWYEHNYKTFKKKIAFYFYGVCWYNNIYKKIENKYKNTRYITNDLSFKGAMTKCSITENNYQCQKEIQYQLDV